MTIKTSDGKELKFRIVQVPLYLEKGLTKGMSVKITYRGELQSEDSDQESVEVVRIQNADWGKSLEEVQKTCIHSGIWESRYEIWVIKTLELFRVKLFLCTVKYAMIMQRYQDYVSAEHGMIRRVSKLMAFDINIMPEEESGWAYRLYIQAAPAIRRNWQKQFLRQCR